jgi:Ca2+/Na+ antiporter
MKASKNNLAFTDSIKSSEFLIAYLLGTMSIFAMTLFYKSNLNLSQGIIFMGATSIILGTFYSSYLLKNKIDSVDMILLIILIIVYSYKVYKLSIN